MPGTEDDERLLPLVERVLVNERDCGGVAVAVLGRLIEDYLDSTRRRQSLIDLLDRRRQFRLGRLEHDHSHRIDKLRIANQRDAKIGIRLPSVPFAKDDHVRAIERADQRIGGRRPAAGLLSERCLREQD